MDDIAWERAGGGVSAVAGSLWSQTGCDPGVMLGLSALQPSQAFPAKHPPVLPFQSAAG